MKKRMISILLVAVLAVGMIPFSKVSAFAELLEVVIKGRTYLREHEQKLLKTLYFYGMDARVSQ